MVLKPTCLIAILRTLNIFRLLSIYFAYNLLLSGFPTSEGDDRLG